MSLSSMLHAILSPVQRGEDELAAIEEERAAAQQHHDAAAARLRRSTANLREMVAETVERVSNGNRRNGRH